MLFWSAKKTRFASVLIFGLILWSAAGCNAENCPKFQAGYKTGTSQSPLIREASGLAASRKKTGILWTHNDDGPACVYAITKEGKYLGSYNMIGARNRDWEDIAVGPGPEANIDYLYIGDIGDNNSKQKSIKVYRVPEPDVNVNQRPLSFNIDKVEIIELIYPDGPRNAETLMVDPLTKDIYIVSKEGKSNVYRAAYPQSLTNTTTLEQVAKLKWGMATGGDISPDGNEIIIRDYYSGSLWIRPKEAPLWKAFEGSECSIPIIIEKQGEAICFDSEGKGYYTTSEKKFQPIYYFARVKRKD